MRPVGVGVIGCGYWGPNLIRNFARHDGASVVAVCDMQVDRATKVARWYASRTVVSDPMTLIDDPQVDIVVVATPAGSHYELAKAAIAAGKHVLLMKPMTTRSDHAEELIALAERRGRPPGRGSHLRLHRRGADDARDGGRGRPGRACSTSTAFASTSACSSQT